MLDAIGKSIKRLTDVKLALRYATTALNKELDHVYEDLCVLVAQFGLYQPNEEGLEKINNQCRKLDDITALILQATERLKKDRSGE